MTTAPAMTSGPQPYAPKPRQRRLFRLAVVVALCAVAAGVVIAVRGYLATAGPTGTVKGYFAALERSDAPAALGFGDLPAGPRTLLTSTVLRAQQKIAPIRDLKVAGAVRDGNDATVSVSYTLAFAGSPEHVQDRLHVLRSGHSWQLAATAVLTHIDVIQALDTVRIAGAGLPDGDVLMFPGAAPVSLDSSYLQLDPGSSEVRFTGGGAELTVEVSPDGRRHVVAALLAALHGCLAGAPTANPLCPLPSDRYVPGSLRGTVAASSVQRLSLTVTDDPAGVIAVVSGSVRVTGRYTVLDFNNRRVSKKGSVSLPIAVTVAARSPAVVQWTVDAS